MCTGCRLAAAWLCLFAVCTNNVAVNDLLPLSLPPSAERTAAIQEAVTEAKAHAKLREDARKAKARVQSSGPVRITGQHFKQVTKEARRQGEARIMFEDIVRRAERKLSEMKRQSHAQIQSAEARAEELASELFHKPGSQLTEEELARIKQESGCTSREAPRCFRPTFQRFRTIDGTCNNLENPFLGAADTAFTRLIPAQYEDGISSLRGGLQARKSDVISAGPFVPPNPSARLISQTVIRNVSEDESLTHILMQWGQFLDHDLSLGPELEDECPERGCEFTEICEPVFVPDRDPVFGVETENNANCLPFSRSLPECDDSTEPQVNGIFRAREQLNVLTSFIDASMVYGANEELAREVRLFQGGLLREGANFPGNQPELPIISEHENMNEEGEPLLGCPNPGTRGCFLAGEFRVNEQIVLTIMHTIWFREHNRIARQLSTINPHWNDERLYQEARRIVGALIQKITYLDYLPKIFGKAVYNIVLGPYRGYDPRIDPGVPNAFATAAYRYGHTLIRPFFNRLGSNFQPIGAGPLNLVDAFFNPDQFRLSFGTDPILRGLVTQNSRRVDEFLSSVLTSRLFRQNLDLAALNIQRGRDHGLPPYLTWRRYCSAVFQALPEPTFNNTLTLVQFLGLYGSLDTVDLWIGGLAEERVPGSLLGPTFACLFGITFANVRDGDRFYYSRPGVFEPAQLRSIQADSLSRVICDNSDNINEIQPDAFVMQSRVPCDTLPKVNLNAWREDVCFFRGRVTAGNSALAVRAFSRTTQPIFTFFSRTVSASTRDVFGCVPVICPTGNAASEVIIYTSNSASFLINGRLPANQMNTPGRYQAQWPASLLNNAGDGVFRTEAQCRASGEVAITVTRTAAVASEEGESPVLFQADDDEEEVPEDIREVLMTPNSRAASAEVQLDSQQTMESEVQLMSELEEALKALKS